MNFHTDLGKVIVLMLKGEKGEKGEDGSSGDYSALTNKPTINGVPVDGAITSDDLGLASQTALQQVADDTESSMQQFEDDIESQFQNYKDKDYSLADPITISYSYSDNVFDMDYYCPSEGYFDGYVSSEISGEITVAIAPTSSTPAMVLPFDESGSNHTVFFAKKGMKIHIHGVVMVESHKTRPHFRFYPLV